MKLVKNAFVLGLVAVWALMTSHCGLENIPGLNFLPCASEAEAASHQPSDCGDDDACASVESGSYRTEQKQIAAEKLSFSSVSFLLALLSDRPALERNDSEVSMEAIPPEFEHTWQFSFRTALPPRAPSILS